MHKTLVIGSQTFTIAPEQEAEIRRLLWALEPRRPRRESGVYLTHAPRPSQNPVVTSAVGKHDCPRGTA
jgi:hypothetical protein